MYSNARKLIVGQKYTYAGFTYTGRPYHIQFILRSIKCVGMENGQDAYELLVMKWDTKSKIPLKINFPKQFIIWEGLHKPDTQVTVMIFTKDFDCGATRDLYCYPPNDNRYMQRALLSVSESPLVQNFNKKLNVTPEKHYAVEGKGHLTLVN